MIRKGLIPIVMIVIVLGILIAGGGAWYWKNKTEKSVMRAGVCSNAGAEFACGELLVGMKDDFKPSRAPAFFQNLGLKLEAGEYVESGHAWFES